MRHQPFHLLVYNVGWIGVDLFFVLSGFLISTLIFKEFKRTNEFAPKQFLIRRGFKIYPTYYLFVALFSISISWNGELDVKKLLSELVFIQNYVIGFGYTFGPSWSLAIEEHFYFGFALLIYLLLKNDSSLLFFPEKRLLRQPFFIAILGLLVLVLFFRYLSLVIELNPINNYLHTHLRMDSIAFGVLVGYLNEFFLKQFNALVQKCKSILVVAFVCFISWAISTDLFSSMFALIFGFTFVYLGFGFILMVLTADNAYYSRFRQWCYYLAYPIELTGKASFVIYIIHEAVNDKYSGIFGALNTSLLQLKAFIITSALSITIGIAYTELVENRILKFRNRYFPSK
jgi:peptidoglycan/LPS O-acetylase OafA/YrhL